MVILDIYLGPLQWIVITILEIISEKKSAVATQGRLYTTRQFGLVIIYVYAITCDGTHQAIQEMQSCRIQKSVEHSFGKLRNS